MITAQLWVEYAVDDIESMNCPTCNVSFNRDNCNVTLLGVEIECEHCGIVTEIEFDDTHDLTARN